MKKYRFGKLTVAAGLCLLVASQACAEGPRRIYWFTWDTLRAESLHFMGNPRPTSPNLDALAEQSVAFRWAISPSNVTRRSVASFFCGRYYSQLTSNPKDWSIPEDAVTVAETLSAAGYRCFAWSTNPYVQDRWGFGQGFDSFEYVAPLAAEHATIDELTAVIRQKYTATTVPEFHYIQIMEPHAPYVPPVPFDRKFMSEPYTRTAVRNGSMTDINGELVFGNLPYFSQVHDVQPADVAFANALYDGAIAYGDARAWHLLGALGYDPDLDLLILTADHGEQFFEHGYWGHGKTLLTQEVHVPLLMRYKSFKVGPREGPVSLIDLFPTLCDMVGATPPFGLGGTSLLPSLVGKETNAHAVYTEPPDTMGPSAAVVGDGYLYWFNSQVHMLRPWQLWPYFEALYDLRNDPKCTTNVIGDHPDVADALNARMRVINPRWKNFTRDVIRGTDADVRLGENLLTPALSNVNPEGSSFKPSSQEAGFGFDAPYALLVLPFETDMPGKAHLFSVQYRLAEGELAFELHDADTDETIWKYQVLKPANEWTQLRSVLYPEPGRFRLLVRMVRPGHSEIRDLTFQRAYMPEVEVIAQTPDYSANAPSAGLSDAEKERLRALGYGE